MHRAGIGTTLEGIPRLSLPGGVLFAWLVRLADIPAKPSELRQPDVSVFKVKVEAQSKMRSERHNLYGNFRSVARNVQPVG